MDYSILNDKQKEALQIEEGPLLILAGAGSGKTRVIVYKIAYFLEKGISPFNILAITFTNKAAREMQDRINNLLGSSSFGMWVCTFHRMCSIILRLHINNIGYKNSFSIYDTDDSKALIKSIIKELHLDAKLYSDSRILRIISTYKNLRLGPEDLKKNARNQFQVNYSIIFEIYEKKLKELNALDFDDLLIKTVELFETFPDILEQYNDRFKYIFVDEYQDTNLIQFTLINLLSKKATQLLAVGDDDQSIYKFRGSDIRNILSFKENYPKAKLIKLEQNYRSTKNILAVANEVISHNKGRTPKTLWTDNDKGDKVRYKLYSSDITESQDIINSIKRIGNIQNTAILYRTNAQSRKLEENCVKSNIPYRLIGGINFYQRKEIKDVLAYLRLINNPNDEVSLNRIINVPKRGIGSASLDKIFTYHIENNITLYEALKYSSDIDIAKKTSIAIGKFVEFIEELKKETTIKDLIQKIIVLSGYETEILHEYGSIEGKERIENINELINKAVDYTDSHDNPNLNEFLADVSLVADIDSYDENENKLTLMTLHSSKGLEFENIYLIGMNEGCFPSSYAITSDDGNDVEEERRLCYVGFTRAMKNLYISSTKQTMINGTLRPCTKSRFIDEINLELLNCSIDNSIGYSLHNSTFPFDNNVKPQNYIKDYKKTSKEEIKKYSSNTYSKISELQKEEKLSFDVQDEVSHIKFGIGKVLQIEDIGRDYEITVDFKDYGIKKLLSKFAKLRKE
ncbi:MAG: UvrD-helicase domain-containing protein [Eubacteriales bacterium]|nr:UvrD-helicase domain-containing protein [Eubacteriales bacterium]